MTTVITLDRTGDRMMMLTSTETLLRREASSVLQRSSTPSPREARQRRECGRILSMLMTTLKH